ncbi:unnamed protein product [Bursaphelenchus xylophilus]|uniref:(pine wood nematode) hypothetical protein n=1 Tax=Bursaphelenchus xylophilus TaxID=6326 RepID=A0A7I8WVS6_BURXY|nr:unnamed protein product [Bursaphelenchus xylophilus]CAG9118014.1 unnamed protein product [Bursaphelenchus xylophilus]
MGICFSVLRCGKCQHTRFFRCVCQKDKCLIGNDTQANLESGGSRSVSVSEASAARVDVVDEVNPTPSEAEVDVHNELFEFGKNDEEDHEFSFTMTNAGDELDSNIPALIVEDAQPNDSMANLEAAHLDTTARKRQFKNKVRRNVVLEEQFAFHLTPTNSMIQVSASTPGEKSTQKSQNDDVVSPEKPARSISGHLSFGSSKFSSSKQNETPKSSVSSPAEFNKLTPKSISQRLNVSLSPNRRPLEVLKSQNQNNFPAIFHPSVMEKGDHGGDDASKASDDEKENEYKPELPPPTPTSEVEDEEVEDEEIKVGNDENCNSRPKTKRRRKNKMNRMKKKARRH